MSSSPKEGRTVHVLGECSYAKGGGRRTAKLPARSRGEQTALSYGRSSGRKSPGGVARIDHVLRLVRDPLVVVVGMVGHNQDTVVFVEIFERVR